MKYEYAKKYFEQKKYARAYTLLGELVTIYKGTDKAEESLYLLARSHYMAKDYSTSGSILQHTIPTILKASLQSFPVFMPVMVIIWILPSRNSISREPIRQ